MLASPFDDAAPTEGRFLLTDAYQELTGVPRGKIKSLRVVAVPGEGIA